MNKIYTLSFVLLLAISLVLAQNTGAGEDDSKSNGLQIKIKSGSYLNSDGEQMQINAENEIKLKVGNVEANSSLEIDQEQDNQNRTKLKINLSNGRNAEIKIMPNTASERAIERLQLKNCNPDNNCTIQLKEVGNGNQTKVAYEIKAEKESRILGFIKTKMKVEAQVNAETGEVIQTKKPWWAFVAVE
ncbi:MAG: hypothetical protein WC548_02295 [Candidatus Pacearchaeota archaeon]